MTHFMTSMSSHIMDYAIAAVVGVFFAVCAWLWMANAKSVAATAFMTGLPNCL